MHGQTLEWLFEVSSLFGVFPPPSRIIMMVIRDGQSNSTKTFPHQCSGVFMGYAASCVCVGRLEGGMFLGLRGYLFLCPKISPSLCNQSTERDIPGTSPLWSVLVDWTQGGDRIWYTLAPPVLPPPGPDWPYPHFFPHPLLFHPLLHPSSSPALHGTDLLWCVLLLVLMPAGRL